MRLNGNLVFNSDATGEVQNFFIERLSAAPTFNSMEKGRIYFNTTGAVYYFNDGSAWQPFATGGNATALQAEVNAIEASIGSAVNADGTYNVAGIPDVTGVVSSATSITNAINQIASAVNTDDYLSALRDVQLGTLQDGQYLQFDAYAGMWKNTTLVLSDVTDVTATATEVNKLSGFTGSTANLNILSGTTASASDLNSITGYAAQSVTPTAFGYIANLTSDAQTQLNNKQPLNPGLTAWSSFVNGSGTGLIIQTGVNSFADRTLASTAADLTITNPDGVAGAPTFGFQGNTAGLQALTTSTGSGGGVGGFVVMTGNGTFTLDALVSGSINNIVVTNGNGVSTSPTIDLATVTQGTSGSFKKITLDAYGRVSGNTAVVTGDITALVDSQYIRLDGTTTPSASINFGGFALQGVGTPVAGTDAANKNYVDSAIVGLEWKAAVKAATLLPGNMALSFAAGSIIDGYTLVAGDRILIKNQADATTNGIYVVQASGAPVRASDASTTAELNNATVFVTDGTANADTGWTQTTPEPVVGTSAIVFQQFTGAGTYTAGTGLQLIGNTFSAQLGAGIGELPTGEIGVDLLGEATSALILTTDGSARSTDASAQLALLLGSAGGLTQDATGLYIPAAGVANAMLAHSSMGIDVDGGGASSIALGGSITFNGSSGQGVVTSVSGTAGSAPVVGITVNDATTASKGVAQFNSASFTVATGLVSISAAGVSNTQLANSSWGISGTTGGVQQIALGGSLSVVGGSAPITTVSAAGTLTINVASATTSTLGLASFNGSQFSVASGAVSMAMSLGNGGLTNVAASVDTAATSDLLQYNGTKWTNNTVATVLSGASLDQIGNVSDTGVVGGDTLIYSAGGANYQARPIYHLYSSGSAATTHTVNHNLGQQYCNVTVVDQSVGNLDEVVIPQSIYFNSNNQLTVTFNSAIACKIVVMGVNAA